MGSVFYSEHFWQSLVGLDGYLAYRNANYYILGEWFLGAIILLYILYPVLLWAFNKSELLTTAAIVCLYIWTLYTDFFVIDSFRNLISCLLSFEVGMLLMKHLHIMQRKYFFCVAIISFFLICLFRYPFGNNIGNHLFGILFFCILYRGGELIMKVKRVNSCIKAISKISFEIFLLQHLIVIAVLEFKNPVTTWRSLILILITILMTLIAAQGLHIIVSAFLSGRPYQLFEKYLYKVLIKR